MSIEPTVLRDARRALSSSGRSIGWWLIGAWIAIGVLMPFWEPDFFVAAVILFGVLFGLPGLYIIWRASRHARSLLTRAELISATLLSWQVHRLSPNRVRYPLALTKYLIELRLQGPPELGEITASAYRGIRRSVDELEEGLAMDLIIDDSGATRTVVVRWPSGKWLGPGGVGMEAALLASR